ncbi:hydantoinase/oxoprolinase family protein [Mesorhizobium sp. J428]|uniref:hydantoinase/oxoprolinase family protein n=1 Tax=Mesorhizobium sp. J428 TaxID=2898440 RepID=UPI00215192E7|nr:hydantoinase/oxoprolinase family protein [Mesorhizobium sp. J428]MCR5857500.1 hydantoinase/oxoprolinase family protein [Mesorhizobium sp. J428]
MTRYSLAVDIGGTFTDAVLLADDGRTFVDKTLTTHGNLLEGFFRGVDLVMGRAGIAPPDVNDVVVHATTVVTNALIERKGPPVGLILTKGFTDILYIRDEHRYDMYDPQIEFAEPLIPRERTWALDERVLADGSVEKTAKEAEIAAIARDCKARGIQSVAVSLINAYRNGVNEALVADVFAREAPEIFVSLSSEIAPQMREYLRTSTVAINAYTVPITRPYLDALIKELDRQGFSQQPLIMLSNGGVIGAGRAGTLPVRMIESGPAAGALVACYFSRMFGIPDLISFDMGGTTAKACMIQNHEPLVTGTFEVDRRYRFKPGSGMPITVPSIDMIEIGAGGGSIAWVDDLGLLRTGPESAGSIPGPVSYRRGGTEPCVTDADVVLGILDPDRFLGGDMKLDAAGAKAAIAKLGGKIGLTAEQTAWGIYEVVCEQMAAATRTHATERGVDYRGLPMLAFGGAGPVHACLVADLIESKQVIYPPLASVLSAFGTLVTPAQIDLVRSQLGLIDRLDPAEARELVGQMTTEGTAALTEAGLAPSDIDFVFGADLRYFGQQSELRIELPFDPRETLDGDTMREIFDREYVTQYGLKLDMPLELVNWHVTARGRLPERAAATVAKGGSKPAPRSRTVHLRGKPVETAVYSRTELMDDDVIAGPVIVEERETTIFVLPGWTIRLHANGSLIADKMTEH